MHAKSKGWERAKLASCDREKWKYLWPRQYERRARRGRTATCQSGRWRKSFRCLLAGEEAPSPRGSEATRPPGASGEEPPLLERNQAAGLEHGPGQPGPAGCRGPSHQRSTGGLARTGGPGGQRLDRGVRGPRWRADSHLQRGHGAGEEILAVLQLLEVGGPRLGQRRGLPFRRHLPHQRGRLPRAHVTAAPPPPATWLSGAGRWWERALCAGSGLGVRGCPLTGTRRPGSGPMQLVGARRTPQSLSPTKAASALVCVLGASPCRGTLTVAGDAACGGLAWGRAECERCLLEWSTGERTPEEQLPSHPLLARSCPALFLRKMARCPVLSSCQEEPAQRGWHFYHCSPSPCALHRQVGRKFSKFCSPFCISHWIRNSFSVRKLLVTLFKMRSSLGREN